MIICYNKNHWIHFKINWELGLVFNNVVPRALIKRQDKDICCRVWECLQIPALCFSSGHMAGPHPAVGWGHGSEFLLMECEPIWHEPILGLKHKMLLHAFLSLLPNPLDKQNLRWREDQGHRIKGVSVPEWPHRAECYWITMWKKRSVYCVKSLNFAQ